ncbi:MAG: 7-cyano-7-deazaguanine synthase QueC [Acidobacteriota bacterium]
MKNGAVILFSGGIDSTTALYWAMEKFQYVFPVIIDYSQRHNIEVINAEKIAKGLGLDYKIINFPLKNILRSSLIDENENIPPSLESSKNSDGIPFTYVPFRNGIFLALAAGIAESGGIGNIITGFNLIDTPDYPDTTETFTKKMEDAINEGTSAALTGNRFTIFTPLINKTKSEIIETGLQLDADYSYSVSCYRGEEKPCLNCPSCDIRSNAFKKLGLEDPLITRLKREGKNET